jgi:predicted nucleic acid-binding protein
MIVADANLLAYFWIPGDHTPAAEAVMKRDSQWCAPLLWRSEFRNILAGYVRRRGMTLATATQIIREAEHLLSGHEFAVPSARVLEVAARSGCSAYDSEYIVLAEDLAVKLVTTDAQLLKSFPALAISVKDFAQP